MRIAFIPFTQADTEIKNMATQTQSNVKKKSSNANGKPASGPGSGGMPKKAAAKRSTAETADRDERLSPVQRATKKLAGLSKRCAGITKSLSGWSPEIMVSLDEVNDAVASLAKSLAKLPPGFKPGKKGGGGGGSLEAGTLVDVTEKAKEKYVGILEDGEWTGLKVLVIANGKVRCKTSGGTIIALPRAHVAPQAVEAGAEDDTDDEEETPDSE